MKQYYNRFSRNVIFVILQIILYVAFLFLDFIGTKTFLSERIKFTMIILCFCYALFYKNRANKSIVFCMKTALLFTVISDLFLLIMDYHVIGVLTFIIAQQLYGAALLLKTHGNFKDNKIDRGLEGKVERERNSGIKENRIKDLPWKLIKRIALQTVFAFIICISLIAAGIQADTLLISSIFYFISILTNTIHAIYYAYHNPKDSAARFFALGLVLFVLCDINVGLFNLSSFLPLSQELYGGIYAASSLLMWIFYAPSQVLIALSVSKL